MAKLKPVELMPLFPTGREFAYGKTTVIPTGAERSEL